MGSEYRLYLHTDPHERAPFPQHVPWVLQASPKTEAYLRIMESPTAAIIGTILVVIFKDI